MTQRGTGTLGMASPAHARALLAFPEKSLCRPSGGPLQNRAAQSPGHHCKQQPGRAEGTADKGPTDPQSRPLGACDGTAPGSAETRPRVSNSPPGPKHWLSSEQQPPARPPCPCSAGSHPSESLGVTRLPLPSPHCPPGWVLPPEDFSWVTPHSSPCRGACLTTTPPPQSAPQHHRPPVQKHLR